MSKTSNGMLSSCSSYSLSTISEVLNIVFHPFYKYTRANAYDDEVVPEFEQSLEVLVSGLLLQDTGEERYEVRRAVIAGVDGFVLGRLRAKFTLKWACRSGKTMEMRRSSW